MEMEILNQILSKLNNIESDMGTIKSDVSTLKQSNSIMEDEIIAKAEVGKTLEERLEVIEMSVAHTSETVSNLSDVIEILKAETGKNSIDIKIIRRKLNKKNGG